MKCKALVLIILVCWASQSSAQPNHSKYSLCKSTEHVVFTCQLKNKMASICASENLSKTIGYIQYRFGDKRKIQIQVPSKKIKDRINVTHEYQLAGASGTSETLKFQSNNYYYEVSSTSYRSDKVAENGSSIWISEERVVAGTQQKILFDRSCAGYTSPIDLVWLDGKIELKEKPQ